MLPFMEHVRELRKRLCYIAISVALFSGLAYLVEHHIVAALVAPTHGQKFIYTTPGGGIDFLFRVCLYTGIAVSLPVIVYQLLRYLEPLIKRDAMRFIVWGSVASGVLALAGMAFGYFIGLPAALHFLLNQFQTGQIEPLLSIQSYMSFVTLYLLGSALLFQVPLILLFINRITPLKPGKLLKFERWVIVGAFVIGGIINPSPNMSDQLMLAIPMILMYQIGVLLIWHVNRGQRRPKKVVALRERDAAARAVRKEQLRAARPAFSSALAPTPAPVAPVRTTNRQSHIAVAATTPSATPASASVTRHKSPNRRYINDFQARRSYDVAPVRTQTENAA